MVRASKSLRREKWTDADGIGALDATWKEREVDQRRKNLQGGQSGSAPEKQLFSHSSGVIIFNSGISQSWQICETIQTCVIMRVQDEPQSRERIRAFWRAWLGDSRPLKIPHHNHKAIFCWTGRFSARWQNMKRGGKNGMSCVAWPKTARCGIYATKDGGPAFLAISVVFSCFLEVGM